MQTSERMTVLSISTNPLGFCMRSPGKRLGCPGFIGNKLALNLRLVPYQGRFVAERRETPEQHWHIWWVKVSSLLPTDPSPNLEQMRGPGFPDHNGPRIWQCKWHQEQAMKNSLNACLSARETMPNPFTLIINSGPGWTFWRGALGFQQISSSVASACGCLAGDLC